MFNEQRNSGSRDALESGLKQITRCAGLPLLHRPLLHGPLLRRSIDRAGPSTAAPPPRALHERPLLPPMLLCSFLRAPRLPGKARLNRREVPGAEGAGEATSSPQREASPVPSSRSEPPPAAEALAHDGEVGAVDRTYCRA
jgi:hypothetical protein